MRTLVIQEVLVVMHLNFSPFQTSLFHRCCYSYILYFIQNEAQCVCEHNTDGPNCEFCLQSYNNRPWSVGGTCEGQ